MGRKWEMAGIFPSFSLSHRALSKCQALCASLRVVNNWEHSHFIACLQLVLTQAFRITAGLSAHLPLRDPQDEFHSAS